MTIRSERVPSVESLREGLEEEYKSWMKRQPWNPDKECAFDGSNDWTPSHIINDNCLTQDQRDWLEDFNRRDEVVESIGYLEEANLISDQQYCVDKIVEELYRDPLKPRERNALEVAADHLVEFLTDCVDTPEELELKSKLEAIKSVREKLRSKKL